MPTNGLSIKPLKVKVLAREQNATEIIHINISCYYWHCCVSLDSLLFVWDLSPAGHVVSICLGARNMPAEGYPEWGRGGRR